jgi:hypothetical protein
MSHREDFIPAIVMTFITTLCFCLLFGVYACKSQRKLFENEAIKRNYATWTNDGEGNPVFTWKEPSQ